MSNPIAYGFRNLARFSGRDGRRTFWPYAGVAFAIAFASMAFAMSLAMEPMWAETQSFVDAHPEAATVTRSPGHYLVRIDPSHPDAPVPDFTGFMMVMIVAVVLFVTLLAAAVSRRLHDIGRNAAWGLTPVVFLIVGLVAWPLMMQDFISSGTPNFALFGLLFLNNMLYLAALAALVIVLALPGQPQANRYGPAT